MESDTVTVRRATLEDGPAFISLIRALADYEKLDPPTEAAQQRLLADAFGPNPRIEVLLAVVGPEAAGYAIFFPAYSSFLALPTLYLEDLFILEKHRGKRLGYRIMKELVRIADERGYGRVEWMVLEWNELAHGFYARLDAKPLKQWVPYRLSREEFGKILGKPQG